MASARHESSGSYCCSVLTWWRVPGTGDTCCSSSLLLGRNFTSGGTSCIMECTLAGAQQPTYLHHKLYSRSTIAGTLSRPSYDSRWGSTRAQDVMPDTSLLPPKTMHRTAPLLAGPAPGPAVVLVQDTQKKSQHPHKQHPAQPSC